MNAKLIQANKVVKLRSFYNMKNKRFLIVFHFHQQLCIDEAMILYFRKHLGK